MTWRDSLQPLRHRPFAWYLASRTVNVFGTTMATVAMAFAVLDLTGSATALGQVLAARTVPMVLLLLFGGVVADRVPRALVLQATNLVSAGSQGVTAVLLLTGHPPLWTLLALQAVAGSANGLGFPAMAGMVPTVVPPPLLQSANALLSMSRGLCAVLGPSAGALLVVTVGSGWAVLADAATWLVAAVLLLPVRHGTVRRSAPAAEGPAAPSMVADLREGWSLFRRTTWLWVVVVAFGVLNAVGTGAWFTLGPALAGQTIGRQAWGWVLSAESAGVLVATAVLLRVRLSRPLVSGVVAISVVGLPMALLGLAPRTGLLMATALLAGAGTEVFTIGWSVAVQENIEEAQLSRAYSYDALGSFAAMPLGQLLYGPLGERFGYAPVVAVSGIAYSVIALSVLASGSVRRLRRLAPATASSGSSGS